MNPAIFSVGNREFSLAHVWSASDFRGEADAIRQSILDALCCVRYAEEEGFEADEDALQAAADEFRLQRGLLTVEDTEAWLEQRALTEDDFVGWLERTWWFGRLRAEVPRLRPGYRPLDSVVADLVWSELVLTGAIARLAAGLALRVAAATEFKEPRDRELAGAARADFLERKGLGQEDIAAWLLQAGWDRNWYEELVAMEAILRHPSVNHVELERLRAALASQRTSLTKVELELARFGSLDAAQEARLSVAEDAEPFAVVCRRAGLGREILSTFVGDLPAELQATVLSAAEGETLKPVGVGGGWVVCHIRRKTDPELESPDVFERVRRPLLEAAHDRLIERHVTWHVPLR